MSVIMHNVLAQNVNTNIYNNNKKYRKSVERLSSGYKVNRAADDAAGLSISEKMRNQIRNLNQSSKNIEDGISFCQTADGGINEVHNILGRMRELAVQAANDVYTDEDRKAINEELDQLRMEINSISQKTEFNGRKIFDTPYGLNFSDSIFAAQIFDSKNGDPNDPESYGGIIVNGHNRVSWNSIDPGMVNADADGNITFNEGSYTYTDADGTDLIIECREGTQPPDIVVRFPVEIENDGIKVGGIKVEWSKIVNDNGKSITSLEDGLYHFPFNSGYGTFSIKDCESMDDVIENLKDFETTYERKYSEKYDGYYRAKAVDMDNASETSMRLTNGDRNYFATNHTIQTKLAADAEGIYVSNADGSKVEGTLRTWASMGITSWTDGKYVSDEKVYRYSVNTGGTTISFDFTLLNETGLESVIEGINNAKLNITGLDYGNNSKFTCTTDDNVVGYKATGSFSIQPWEEAALGRNLDIRLDEFGNTNLSYNAATNKMSLNMLGTDGSSVVKMNATGLTSVADIKKYCSDYAQYVQARKVQAALSGGSISYPTLDGVIGAGNVTGTGYMSEIITINKNTMKTTSSLSNGSTYPGIKMDYSGLGTEFEWYDLLGTGFNSTCKTCSNHYSVMYVYGDTEKTTSQGYGYTKTDNKNGDYVLQIDLKSMFESGKVKTAAQFTDAVIDVIKAAGFDFHFTQYASEDGVLYACDDRSQSTPAPQATFDTEPYGIDVISIDMNIDKTKLNYTYDVKNDLAAYVGNATVVEAADGKYVSNGKKLELYDANNYYDSDRNLLPGMTEPKRYNINAGNRNLDWDAYYDHVMNNIAAASEFSIVSSKFITVKGRYDENDNSGIVSDFEFEIEDTNDFWIQSGANENEDMSLKWDRFNAYTLGLGEKEIDVSNHTKATKLLHLVDDAAKKISGIRSKFGAYTNRMEYSLNNNKNYSENLQSAESAIRDTNMAEEVAESTKMSILLQAAQAMLSQANQSQQGVLSLLQ